MSQDRDFYNRLDKVINEMLDLSELTPNDVMTLVVARRLALCTEQGFVKAMNGRNETLRD